MENKENDLIVSFVKDCPCLYDKEDDDYYNDRIKRQYFKDIAMQINIKLNLQNPLTEEQVKIKWENLRRTYVKCHKDKLINGKKATHYLYDKMSFLNNHIKHYNNTSTYPNDSSQQDATMERQDSNAKLSQSSKRKAVSLEDEENIDFQDIVHLFQQPKKQIPNTPKPDKFYEETKNLKTTLESKALNVMQKTLKDMTNNQDRENKYDCYILSIREALKTIPPKEVLACVTGILQIMNTYTQQK